MDPKGICADDNLESVIRKCQLTDLVHQIGGIDGSVGESGSILSAGQKQLVCLARALLVNPAVSSLSFCNKSDKFLVCT